MHRRNIFVASCVTAGAVLFGPLIGSAATDAARRSVSPSPPERPGLSARVLQLALSATSCAVAQGAVGAPETLTVIDYSRPSTDPRFWVVDLASREILFEELVAHGAGSGDNFATRFSNDPESHQSSLGLFATREPYIGKHGYSLRLNGLEPSNSLALERAIVIHGASYVSGQVSAALGRLGRSWGCPALRPEVSRGVIDRIKGRGVVFAYYPDPAWLDASPFLHGCAGQTNHALNPTGDDHPG